VSGPSWKKNRVKGDKGVILFLCVLGFFLEGLESLFGFLKLLSQLRIFRLEVAGSFVVI